MSCNTIILTYNFLRRCPIPPPVTIGAGGQARELALGLTSKKAKDEQTFVLTLARRSRRGFEAETDR